MINYSIILHVYNPTSSKISKISSLLYLNTRDISLFYEYVPSAQVMHTETLSLQLPVKTNVGQQLQIHISHVRKMNISEL